jgi:FixJ family two-component response regulator
MVISLKSSVPDVDRQPVVFVVDGDPVSRRELVTFLRSVGRSPKSFASCEEFLEHADGARPGCVVIDIGTQGCRGLEAVAKAIQTGIRQPILVRAMDPDIPIAVQAMRMGAANFLDKLTEWESLHTAIEEAIAWDDEQRRQRGQQACLFERFATLNVGQRDVLGKLLEGKPNKAIAAELAVSLRTVEVRRARLMQKTQAQSLAELVRMAMTVKQAEAECLP